jgi:hypothetical protein
MCANYREIATAVTLINLSLHHNPEPLHPSSPRCVFDIWPNPYRITVIQAMVIFLKCLCYLPFAQNQLSESADLDLKYTKTGTGTRVEVVRGLLQCDSRLETIATLV